MAEIQTTEQQSPHFSEALKFWWKLGWISFGGTAAHLAIMHDYLVERKRWISNALYLHALSLCMLLPGPEATQLAIYIGWRLHGKKGGIAAGALFVLPATFVLLALSIVYVRFGNLPWMTAAFAGLRPAVVALVILALWRVGSRALTSALQWAVALLAFLAMLLHVSAPVVMLCIIPIGIVIARFAPHLIPVVEEDDSAAPDAPPAPKHPWHRALQILAVTVLLWALPLPLLYLFGKDFAFWWQLSHFFTRAAFITIGGSYTILPYVAQVVVTKYLWLTRGQMLDGFALAESTPGPLIIVVSYVGFMAGFQHFNGSLWMGAIALLLTTFYTFLPCYLFVFAGAPLVEITRGHRGIGIVLKLIMAVVVASMLDLLTFLVRGVVLPASHIDWPALIWIAVTILLIRKFKLNLLLMVALSVAAGLVRKLVFGL